MVGTKRGRTGHFRGRRPGESSICRAQLADMARLRSSFASSVGSGIGLGFQRGERSADCGATRGSVGMSFVVEKRLS